MSGEAGRSTYVPREEVAHLLQLAASATGGRWSVVPAVPQEVRSDGEYLGEALSPADAALFAAARYAIPRLAYALLEAEQSKADALAAAGHAIATLAEENRELARELASLTRTEPNTEALVADLRAVASSEDLD